MGASRADSTAAPSAVVMATMTTLTTKAVTAITRALARMTRGRDGTAANVTRMVLKRNSWVMRSTPTTASSVSAGAHAGQGEGDAVGHVDVERRVVELDGGRGQEPEADRHAGDEAQQHDGRRDRPQLQPLRAHGVDHAGTSGGGRALAGPVLLGPRRRLEEGLLERALARGELVEDDAVGEGQLADGRGLGVVHVQRAVGVRLDPGALRRRAAAPAGPPRGRGRPPSPVVLWATNSATLVWAMSRPLPITTRSSAISAISASRWLDTNTVRPWRASAWRNSRTHWMPSGSRPLPGSSRRTVPGSPSSARARPTRWRMPSEKPPTFFLATGVEADDRQHLVDPGLRRCRSTGRRPGGGCAPCATGGCSPASSSAPTSVSGRWSCG